MTDKRQGDTDSRRSWLRSGSRVFALKGLWYFHTREGTVEGPYTDKYSAERVLEDYVRVMGSKFAPSTSLSLADEGAAAPRTVDPLDLGMGRLVRQR